MPKIVHPTSNVTREPVESVAHRDAPAAPGQSPDVMLELSEGLVLRLLAENIHDRSLGALSITALARRGPSALDATVSLVSD